MPGQKVFLLLFSVGFSHVSVFCAILVTSVPSLYMRAGTDAESLSLNYGS